VNDRTTPQRADVGTDDVSDHPVAATEVDARGLSCPMPVIELAKAIRDVEVGERVRLLATDPAAKVDVPVWCRMQRQQLVRQEEAAGVWTFDVDRVR
jgi:tRNA 2-thiouridine synthesizing protein A